MILKGTSRVRDLDIKSKKLQNHDTGIYIKALLVSLKTERVESLRKPLNEARRLSKKKVPMLKDVKWERVERWTERTISKLKE